MNNPDTILIVDDSESARDTLEAMLAGEGYRLEFAADGPEALKKVSELRPGLVLLDVMMPGMDGFEVCRRLKSDEAVQYIPVVMVTALDSKEDLVQGLDAGADDFVSKPVNNLELRARVRSLLRAKRQYDELVRAEEAIKTSLREKEVLLKEIHHRVKNNMQTIIGLLDMQSRYCQDERYDVLLQESCQRVHSMALVHERLYQSEDLSQVDFGAYLRELGRELRRFYGANRVALKVVAEEVSVGVDKAIPCGLIVNELVSNALKHAFPPGRAGEISISLRPVDEGDGELELVVSDDGVGLEEGLDFRNTGSMGLYLVVNLVERQLGGRIELDRTAGTEFRITFHGR